MESVHKGTFCCCKHCGVSRSVSGAGPAHSLAPLSVPTLPHHPHRTQHPQNTSCRPPPPPPVLGEDLPLFCLSISWSILGVLYKRIIWCLSFGVWAASLACFSKVHSCRSLCLNVFPYYTWVISHCRETVCLRDILDTMCGQTTQSNSPATRGPTI